MSQIHTFYAPAAANYSGDEGKVVYQSAIVSGKPRCTLSTDPTSEVPLGIIVSAENENGGAVSVCIAGKCKASAGATLTPGTHFRLAAAADSKCDPASAGDYVVGFYLSGGAAAADGDDIDIFVNIGQEET